MTTAGNKSGAIEHRYRGKSRIELSAESREMVQLLAQEAQVRRDFGEEGVELFWQEVEKKALAEAAGGHEVKLSEQDVNHEGK